MIFKAKTQCDTEYRETFHDECMFKTKLLFCFGGSFRCNKLIMSNFLWESRLRVSNANVQAVGPSEQFVLSVFCL